MPVIDGLLFLLRLSLVGLLRLVLLLLALILMIILLIFWIPVLLLLVLVLLLLVLFLLFLLLALLFFFKFLFSHLQIPFCLRIAGSQAQALFVGFHRFPEFVLLQLRIAEIVQGIGLERRIGRSAGGLLKTDGCIFPVALLVECIAEVVLRQGIAVFQVGGIAVVFFRFFVMLKIVLRVAVAQVLVGGLGGEGWG